MEPESSIPNSQDLSTCPYPEPDQSSPHDSIPPLQDPSVTGHQQKQGLGVSIERT
jgi:hypothetical protein